MAGDVAVAVVVLGVALLGAPPTVGELGAPRVELGLDVLLPITAASALLLVRRDFPRLVWVGTVLVSCYLVAVGDEPGRGFPATVVALYTVAAHVGRRWAVVSALVTMAVGALAAVRGFSDGLVDPVTLAVLPWCGLAAALGDAVRVNRLRLADARERARVAEQTRDEEARRRVAEERLHLSRELHDVIGHQLAVINVQAGAAEQLTRSDPVAAAEAMAQVRSAAAEALQQTGRLVGLLRTAEEEPREPTPHLAKLADLVARTRAGGVEVLWNQRGEVATGDPVVDQHGYRIAQEALTNAVRHGDGRVVLTTRRDDDALTLEVRNRVLEQPREAGASSGHGLVGMRERAALCGGTMSVERVGDQHLLSVRLPVRDAGDVQPVGGGPR